MNTKFESKSIDRWDGIGEEIPLAEVIPVACSNSLKAKMESNFRFRLYTFIKTKKREKQSIPKTDGAQNKRQSTFASFRGVSLFLAVLLFFLWLSEYNDLEERG